MEREKMCKKLKGCARNIDPCLLTEIKKINEESLGECRTWSSCCGHGRYKPTIIILMENKFFVEWYSGRFIMEYDRSKRKQHIKIYKKDQKGFYHIPNISKRITFLETFSHSAR